MMPSKLKIGIIGCGRIAQQVHIPILSQCPEVELVGLVDIEAANLQRAKRSAPQAREYKSYNDLLARTDIDAVVIATSTGTHAETAIAAFEADKHVYLEKPLSANLHDAGQVLAAWKDGNKIGMIGFNYRFNQSYLALRNNVLSGNIGSPIAARSVFNSGDASLPTWKTNRNKGGGVLLDLASHHIDLIRFVLQTEVLRVFACIPSVRTEADTAMLQLDLENGLIVQSFFSLCSTAEQWFDVFGLEGKLRARPYDRFDIERTEKMPSASAAVEGWRSLGMNEAFHSLLNKFREPPLQASYRASLNHFVTCVQTNRPASPDLMDGYRSLAVIEAAEESARTGQVICLSQMADIPV